METSEKQSLEYKKYRQDRSKKLRPKSNNDYVFVYGSLKSTGSNHHVLHFDQYALFIGPFFLPGFKMYDDGDRAIIVPSHFRSDVVHGELYQILNPKLKRDILKWEESGKYTPIEIKVKDLGNVLVFIRKHVPLKARGKRIKSGVWTKK